jgi:hypothetical protein
MLPESDRIRLRHMLEAAQQARTFALGRNRTDKKITFNVGAALRRGDHPGQIGRRSEIGSHTPPLDRHFHWRW